MFLRLIYAALSVVFSASLVLAQMPPQPAGNMDANGQLSSRHIVFVTGKVLAEDGSLLPKDLVIERVCGDRVFAEAYPDTHGDFQFQLSNVSPTNMASGRMQAPGDESQIPTIDWNNCELRANVAGFTSSTIALAGKIAGVSVVNVGNLFIRRLVGSEGNTGSVALADLAAPEKAKKDFVKGENSIHKSDWKSAQQNLRKAIDRYPQFSVAWVELARVQQQLGDSDSARLSFQRALKVNPRMLVAYMGLSEIALTNRRWKDLADSTDRLLAINAEQFPQFWLLNAVAKYNLGLVDPAETSVVRGLHLDTQHRYPKMEQLFGVILGVKRQYAQAADHLKAYLRLVPMAADAGSVEAQLYRFQQLAERPVAGK